MAMFDTARGRHDGEPSRPGGDHSGSQAPADVSAPGTRVAIVSPNVPAHPNPYGRRGSYDSHSLDSPVDLHATFLEYSIAANG